MTHRRARKHRTGFGFVAAGYTSVGTLWNPSWPSRCAPTGADTASRWLYRFGSASFAPSLVLCGVARLTRCRVPAAGPCAFAASSPIVRWSAVLGSGGMRVNALHCRRCVFLAPICVRHPSFPVALRALGPAPARSSPPLPPSSGLLPFPPSLPPPPLRRCGVFPPGKSIGAVRFRCRDGNVTQARSSQAGGGSRFIRGTACLVQWHRAPLVVPALLHIEGGTLRDSPEGDERHWCFPL